VTSLAQTLAGEAAGNAAAGRELGPVDPPARLDRPAPARSLRLAWNDGRSPRSRARSPAGARPWCRVPFVDEPAMYCVCENRAQLPFGRAHLLKICDNGLMNRSEPHREVDHTSPAGKRTLMTLCPSGWSVPPELEPMQDCKTNSDG
jgi:hypothetical protein